MHKQASSEGNILGSGDTAAEKFSGSDGKKFPQFKMMTICLSISPDIFSGIINSGSQNCGSKNVDPELKFW